jgi:hypothetical protein
LRCRYGDKTEVRFTHAGLVPAYECYDDVGESAPPTMTGAS